MTLQEPALSNTHPKIFLLLVLLNTYCPNSKKKLYMTINVGTNTTFRFLPVTTVVVEKEYVQGHRKRWTGFETAIT